VTVHATCFYAGKINAAAGVGDSGCIGDSMQLGTELADAGVVHAQISSVVYVAAI
jgi:hypothetical protein